MTPAGWEAIPMVQSPVLLDAEQPQSHEDPVSPAPPSVRRLIVYLLKPSRYDDEGYVVRHWRGVLPSNTLACLDGLTRDVAARRVLGEHVEVETRLVDETVQKIPMGRIARASRRGREGTKVVVALAGVQSNQFARATDIARELRRSGVTVMIGGFHVSGMLAMFPEGTPDIAALTDIGVTVVAGEIEDRWGALLSDAATDRLQPLYNFLADPPDLALRPLPAASRRYLKHFAMSNFGTIDASRGCPFNCSFCTIINVQGRRMRCRDAHHMRRTFIENYRQGITRYFFTDDNFSRNRNWKDIFLELIDLRGNGYDIQFMMQIDTIAYRIEGFVELAGRAGCTQVFIGMESINAENLKAVGKTQNDTSEYAGMVEAWHRVGVAAHVGYIIGFPFDTLASVKEDVRRLADEVKVDQASFFMFTPLPGSRDHRDMVRRGEYLDPDYNKYDSFHAAMRHPRMTDAEWTAAYKGAWADFYRLDNMKAILRRAARRMYWNVFDNFMWYKHSILVDGSHPMVTGFIRLKGRLMRRPGYPIETRRAYVARRVREVARDMRLRWRLVCELQELWLQTRRRTDVETRVADALAGFAVRKRRARLRVADWQAAFAEAQARVPSRVRLFLGRANLLSLRWTYTRQDLNNFWRQTRDLVKRRAFLRINWPRVAWNLMRDTAITVRFTMSFALRT